MPIFTWHTTSVPSNILVRQVYGFCFDTAGRVLLRADGNKYSLPGGRPEHEETGFIETLIRECLEEVNTVVERVHFLGYQLVDDQDGSAAYAQVRLVALVQKIRTRLPDPDTGRTYDRLLTSANRAGELLNWGRIGFEQSRAAGEMAAKIFNLHTESPAQELFV